MSNVFQPTEGNSPGFMDRAETFGESDVTVTNIGTIPNNESLQHLDSTYSDSTSYNDTYFGIKYAGVVLTVSSGFTSIDVTVSSTTSRFSNAEVRARSDGSILKQIDVSGVSSGETFTMEYDFDPSQDYIISLSNNGSGFDAGYQGGSMSGTSIFGVPAGWSEGAGEDTDHYCISGLSVTPHTGTVYATVEWGIPNDLASWDVAPFQTSPDGETVQVFIEEYDGSSWNEIAGPIGDGDDIPAESSRDVRFRVELTRPDTSKYPTLDAIYRRYVV